jgi:hypothetical protein
MRDRVLTVFSRTTLSSFFWCVRSSSLVQTQRTVTGLYQCRRYIGWQLSRCLWQQCAGGGPDSYGNGNAVILYMCASLSPSERSSKGARTQSEHKTLPRENDRTRKAVCVQFPTPLWQSSEVAVNDCTTLSTMTAPPAR